MCAHRAEILPARGAVEIIRIGAEMLLQKGEWSVAQVGAGDDAQLLHPPRRHRPHAVEALDRQRGDEGGAFVRRDDAEAVGLVLVRCQFGDELVVADAGRGGEAGRVLNPRADLFGDRLGRAQAMAVFADVQIGFVERQRFDRVGIIGEDRADLVRHGLVHLEPWADEDEVGAAPDRGDRGHRRSHAERARLVTRRRHHAARPAATDCHRLAPQRRIVALFDRGVEGVHVDVNDLAHGGRRAVGHRAAIPPIPSQIKVLPLRLR